MSNRPDNHDVIYIRRVPKDVKKQFHILCLEKGVTLRDMIIAMMKRAISRRDK